MGERNETRLAQLRRARGLTQAQIAYDLGVSKATYSSWESGRIELGAERIRALAERLCCTPNDILGFGKAGARGRSGGGTGVSGERDAELERYEALTPEELHALKLFRSCPPNIRHSILDIMQTTVKGWRLG